MLTLLAVLLALVIAYAVVANRTQPRQLLEVVLVVAIIATVVYIVFNLGG
jgi:hypothetical protein